ncbi:kelch repeat-containing protein [Puia sp. P3]|uniref:kelch repeat-containing protein n=1 Tax=Puia sp. P3 TaxID=3423952 RepID=UPI003D665A1C
MKRPILLYFVLSWCEFSFGQNYEWTWVSGTNGHVQGNVAVGRGVADPSNVPGLREPAASWMDKAGNFWVFGGSGGWFTPFVGGGDLNDLWEYSPSTNQWTWVSGDLTFNQPGVYGTMGVASAGNKPGARSRSVGWTDKDGNLWLFGGMHDGGTYTSYMSDLWKFDPSTSQWTWVGGSSTPNQPAVYGTRGTPSSSNFPPGLFRAMGWTDHNGMFWLYGGTSSVSGVVDDLWKYNPSNNQWTWVRGIHKPTLVFPDFEASWGTMRIPSPSNSPGARIDCATWVDPANNLWLFGAGPGINLWNDLWKYDPVLDQWTWMSGQSGQFGLSVGGTKGVAAPGNVPSCRYGSIGMTDAGGNLWLFGGYGMGNNPVVSSLDDLNDLWKYDPAAGQWTWMSGDLAPVGLAKYGTKGVSAPTNKPGGRIWSAGWTDASGQLWVFGGSGYLETNSVGGDDDLWKYALPTAITITQVSATAACAGGGLQISYTSSGSYAADNVFTAELSDGSGSFGSPVNIGTMKSGAGGVMGVIIPPGTSGGTQYRIRIVSSSPVRTSPDNGGDITVYGKMTVDLTGTNTAGICPGASARLSAVASGGKPPYQYNWSDGETGAGIVLSPSADMTVKLTVTDDGCWTAEGSLPLTVAKESLVVDGNAPLCPGGTVVLNAHSGYSAYLWQDGSADSVASVGKPGVFGVDVVTGCGTSLHRDVTVVDAPPLPSRLLADDTTICSYDVLPLPANGVFTSYKWSTGATASSIVVDKPGLYWLQVTDKNSCTGRDSIQVDLKKCPEGFFMPSAFTPNGDGHNDILRPKLAGRVERMKFSVYDRWGVKVFETVAQGQGWDGRLGSGETAAGVFVWVCEYQFAGQQVRVERGTVVAVK